MLVKLKFTFVSSLRSKDYKGLWAQPVLLLSLNEIHIHMCLAELPPLVTLTHLIPESHTKKSEHFVTGAVCLPQKWTAQVCRIPAKKKACS